MATETIHEFERAGLGVAPFRFVGCEERRGPIRSVQGGVVVEVGAPGQPMGVCDFCGQGIAVCCAIRSADGRGFVVGTTCVEKTSDAGLRRGVKAALRKRTKAAEHARIEAARALWAAGGAVRAAAASVKHSHPNCGHMSGADEIDFLFKNAGHAGMLRAARKIDKLSRT